MKLATRISVFFLTALAIVLIGFSASIYWMAHSHLHRRMEERSAAAIDTLATVIESGPTGLEWEAHSRVLDVDQSTTSDRLVWEVFDERGKRVDGAQDAASMLAALGPKSEQGEPLVRDIQWNGELWRVRRREFKALPTADVDHREPDDEPNLVRYRELVIVVGTSLSRVTAQLRTLALLLTGLSLVIWLSAAALGRWFCRNALAPLTQMADSIAMISADDLKERIASVDSGDELEELSRAFNQLLDRLQVSFERQGRFAAEASHQLRTPLTAMLGQLDVSMRRARSADEYLQTLKSVRGQTTNLQRIIEMLLFLTRDGIEADAPQFERLELNTWVDDHIALWQEHPRAADLHVETVQSASLWIRAHAGLLGQVLDNLIDNACKYSEPGSPITIRTSGVGKQIKLTVEDCGYGIDQGDLPRVIDPFYRSDDARSRGIGGTGLGLSIVQKIADAFGAQLRVESRVGQGSKFTIEFPALEIQQLEHASY